MKLFTLVLFFICCISAPCKGQYNEEAREYYNKDFNWSIVVPSGFRVLSEAEWNQAQKMGAQLMGKSIKGKVQYTTKPLCAFRYDLFTYFDANYQSFDPKVDGSHKTKLKNLKNLLYKSFADNLPPGSKIDSVSVQDTISGLMFQGIFLKIQVPGGTKSIYTYTYARLFGKKEIIVNLVYTDGLKGEAMVNAWKQSRFGAGEPLSFSVVKKKEKEKTSLDLLGAIETGDLFEAVKLLDPKLTEGAKQKSTDNIKNAIAVIQNYTKTCRLNLIPLGTNDSTLTFACKYVNKATNVQSYEIDISFDKKSTETWVNFVSTIDEKTLLENPNKKPDPAR